MKPLEHLSFRIRPVPPFRLDLTAWALRRRRENIVDRWDGSVYRRVLMIEGYPIEVEVSQTGSPERSTLQVTAKGERLSPEAASVILATLEQMLGLRLDLKDFYAFAGTRRRLAPLADRFRGMKPPRFPTLFEAVANGIACQQLSLTVGIILLSRLAEKYGVSFSNPGGNSHSFALPEGLAKTDISRFRALGFSTQKSRALIELARIAVVEGTDLGDMEKMDNKDVLERLYQLRGVGRWTGEYALLRGLGRIAVFPGDDIGARNKLQLLLHVKNLDYERVGKIMKRWQPYGGFIYFHLLLAGLAAEGYLE